MQVMGDERETSRSFSHHAPLTCGLLAVLHAVCRRVEVESSLYSSDAEDRSTHAKTHGRFAFALCPSEMQCATGIDGGL